MQVGWINERTKNRLEDSEYLVRNFGEKGARSVVQRILELRNAPSYAHLPRHTRPHPIKQGKKFLYYAVDVPSERERRGKNRLLFKPDGDYDLAHVETIKSVVILGVDNYHR